MNVDQRRLMFLVFCGLLSLRCVPCLAQEKKATSPQQLDLNIATAEQLDRLPEVGPKLAAAIVAFRKKSGPFRRVEELLAVPGVTKRRLEKIRPYVYIGEKKEAGRAPTGSAVRPASG